MITNTDIQQGAITESKLSKNLRVKLANLEAGTTAGQVPVVQSNGDLEFKELSGDLTLSADGSTTVTSTVTTTTTETVSADHDHDGLLSASDKAKLDGIEVGAKGDQNAAEIKGLYESNSDTNAFTDSEQSKLASLPANAEENVNADWNATTGDAKIFNKPTLGTAAAAATTDFAAANHNHDHNALTNYDVAEHRVIDDTSTTDQDKLWSAYKIVTELATKPPYNTATSTTDGLMDNTDKVFLDKLAAQISIPSSGNTAGFIGINDTSPSYRLDVDGTARFTSAVKFGGYTFPVMDGDVGKALVTDGMGTLSFSNIAVANVTGLGDSATKDVGTGSTNVAAGDHSHSTGNNGFVPAAGSSGQFLAHDGAFAAVAASNVTGLGDAATRDVGIGSGEVAAGNHTHSDATTSVAGFLSTTDKTKLDSYPSTNSTHNDEFLRKDGTFQSVPAAVSKKEITVEWGTDYSSNSVIDNITSGGSWTADAVTLRLYHNFGTEHIIVSVLDKDNAFGKGDNSQLDLNIQNNDDATVFINSSNSCDIKFNYVDNSISTNDTFKITIVG